MSNIRNERMEKVGTNLVSAGSVGAMSNLVIGDSSLLAGSALALLVGFWLWHRADRRG